MADRTHRARLLAIGAARALGSCVRRAADTVSRLDTVRVDGQSMSPGIRHADLLLVLRGAPVRPGDVVLLRRPDQPHVVVVKRAVTRLTRGWWVAGDNPSLSDDSRTFGVVPGDMVLGRVLLRYWPPGSRSR